MSTIQIEAERCKKCGTCVQICPTELFEQDAKGSVPKVLDTAHCIDCGHCVAICPNEAISHSSFPSGSIHTVHPEMLPNVEQLMELLRSRRSVREFKNKPVERELIEQVIDGARFAPSAHNVQSTEFIVIQDKAILSQIVRLTVERLKLWSKLLKNPVIRTCNRLIAGQATGAKVDELADYFAEVFGQYEQGVDLVLHDAPTLLLFHADPYAGFAAINANLALQNASLVCETLGLGAFYIGYAIAACNFNHKMAKLLQLPPKHKVYGGLAIGYPKFHYQNWIERNPARINWLL